MYNIFYKSPRQVSDKFLGYVSDPGGKQSRDADNQYPFRVLTGIPTVWALK